MASIAVIALGLAFYRSRVAPWLAIRQVHPDIASVRNLVGIPGRSIACTDCHSTATKTNALALSDLVGPCTLNAGMNANVKGKDCRACHGP